MTRAELVQEIFDRLPPYYKTKLPKTLINMVIDNMFEVIMEQLMIGVPVHIRKFGRFDPFVRSNGKHWDYKLGEVKDVRPYLIVYFRLSRKWKLISRKMVR